MTNLNMSGSSDYSSGPRGAAVRDSRVTSGSTTRLSATQPSRTIKVEVPRTRERGTAAQRRS